VLKEAAASKLPVHTKRYRYYSDSESRQQWRRDLSHALDWELVVGKKEGTVRLLILNGGRFMSWVVAHTNVPTQLFLKRGNQILILHR